MQTPWVVALVCGASGTGKSCVARPLAARYGVPLAEADDIVTALQAITTPQQQPMLHFWDTHPEARDWAPGQIAARHFEVASALRPAYAAVIADHVEFAAPVVFEGDYLLPELAAEAGKAVRAVVLDERDEDQITANYLRREPGGQQRDRARVSALVSAELARRARRCGIPVVTARPYTSRRARAGRPRTAVLPRGRSRPASRTPTAQCPEARATETKP